MSQALHYPTIEFRDQDAFKRSLLVWDRIHRIVPDGYVPDDHPEVVDAVGAGVVQNLALDSKEKSKAASRFLDFFALRDSLKTRLTWPAGFSTGTFTRINPDKVDAKLLPLYEQLAQRMTDDGFLEVPHEHAGGYMFSWLPQWLMNERSISQPIPPTIGQLAHTSPMRDASPIVSTTRAPTLT